MPVRSSGNITVTYNATNITQYLSEVELNAAIDELETTHLASTSMTYIPSMANYTLTLSGDFAIASDNVFGPDMMNPTLRTVIVTFTEGAQTVTYTWTNSAFLTGYSLSASSTEKITHAPALRLSGTPTRVVA